ncbi:Fic family protein [Ferrovum myxofaciens]|nr:Fic family protein [Ferrovum myxofaciens]
MVYLSMRKNIDTLATLIFSSAEDQANAQRVSRLARAGKLRAIHRGIYTSDLESPLEQIVRPNWRQIAEHLYPGSILGYRSAQEGKPDSEGRIFLVQGNRARRIELPGLTLMIIPGPGPISGREAALNDTPYGKLFVSSEARRLLENLYTGRDAAIRTMGRAWVESQLSRLCTLRGEHKVNDLRDATRQLAEILGMDAQFKALNSIVSALMRTGDAGRLGAVDALARAAGKPYDPDRLIIFDALFTELRQSFPHVPDPTTSGLSTTNFSFFEAYFSNYIEGTTFTVEEASEIIFEGKIIEKRSEDSHDVLGTYQAITRQPFRSNPPGNEDEFLEWLKLANHRVLSSRPDKNPGQWKEKLNQAGSTLFVHPELVQGTLREGFKRVALLEDPLARALMAMFVITEVHPFGDGNGRTARLAMNTYLTQASACRIIIPTAYREDYLLPLKALSRNTDPIPFVRSMTRIQAWSAAFDYSNFQNTWKQMAECNAFSDDIGQHKLLHPHEIRNLVDKTSNR